MSDTLSKNKDRFLELSKGVNEFSKNLSLSEEDYAEYLSILQKIAETAQKLNELLETQQTISKQTLADNLDTVALGVYYEVNGAQSAITQLQQDLSDAKKEASEITFDIAEIVKTEIVLFSFQMSTIHSRHIVIHPLSDTEEETIQQKIAAVNQMILYRQNSFT